MLKKERERNPSAKYFVRNPIQMGLGKKTTFFFLVHITEKSRGNFQASGIMNPDVLTTSSGTCLPPSLTFVLLCFGVIHSGSSLCSAVSSYLYLSNLATSVKREHLSKSLSRCHWLWLAQYGPDAHCWTVTRVTRNGWSYISPEPAPSPQTTWTEYGHRQFSKGKWACCLQKKGMLGMQKSTDAHIPCLTAYYLCNMVISSTRIDEI